MTLRNLSADDPSVTFDFRKSKYLDPRITFTRASFAPAADPGSGTGTVSGQLQLFNVNVPRLTDKGLLIEEARTNYQFNSEAFAVDTGWRIKTDYTRGANTTEPAPDGSNTACEFFEVTGGGVLNGVEAAQTLGGQTLTSGRLTISVYNKPINCDKFMIMAASTGQNFANCTSIVNNTWTFNSIYVESAKAEPVGNGWYRMSATMIVPTTQQFFRPLFSSQMYGVTVTPDSSQGCTLWGAQAEEGSFVTSYIPNTATSATAVTRAADVCMITGDDFNFFNESEFTLVSDTYSSHLYGTAAAAGRIVFIQSNSVNNHVFAIHGSTHTALSNSYYKRSTGSPDQYMRNPSASQNLKAAWGIGSTSAEAHNGSIQSSALSFSTGMPVCTEMSIGHSIPNSTWFNGPIRKLSMYPTRLADSALQALTY